VSKDAATIREPQVFKYEKPETDRPKANVVLSRTDISLGAVQVVRTGGETNLHAHKHMEGFWFVLAGRARFYTDNDEIVAELGKHEGVLIPRGYRYWFEAIEDEELEILQVESFDKIMRSQAEIEADREDDATERPEWLRDSA
jgi:mannose-6-phosphate isomerase-like protein (cupin superfamily)